MEEASFLQDLVVTLTAALLVLLPSRRLRIPAAVGFMLTGILIGPGGLGLIGDPHHVQVGQINRYFPWNWIDPVLGAFLQSADEQQVNLVKTFFELLDFRRFQVDLRQPILMDDPSKISQLSGYGDDLGRMILNDLVDSSMQVIAAKAP